MENFKLNMSYVEKDYEGDLFVSYNKVAKCTCGFIEIDEEIGQITSSKIRGYNKCPKCGAIKVSQYNSEIFYGYEFTYDKAVIKYINLKVHYHVNKTEDGKEIPDIDLNITRIDFVFCYEINKKGKEVFRSYRIINGEKTGLLKSDITNNVYFTSDTKNEVKKAIESLSNHCCYYNNAASTLWNIHNRYKFGRNTLYKDLHLIGFSDLDEIRKLNKLCLNIDTKIYENLSRYIKQQYKLRSRYYRDEISMPFYDFEKLMKNIKSNKINIDTYFNTVDNVCNNSQTIANRFRTDMSSIYEQIIELIEICDFTIEDILNLGDIAERQAFNFTSYRVEQFTKFYKLCKQLDMYIDKAPKELMIMYDKFTAIFESTSDNSKSIDIEDSDNIKVNIDFSCDRNYVLKKLYHDFEGYKTVDKYIFENKMNNIYAQQLYSHNYNVEHGKVRNYSEDIFFNKVVSYKIDKTVACLTKENELITDEELIRKRILNNRKELKNNIAKKECDASC